MYKRQTFPTQSNFKSYKKYYFYFLVIGIFIVAHIFLALETVAYGSRLATLENESEQLSRLNKSLELEFVTSTSLLKLKENSDQLGFGKPTATIYVSDQESVASLRK